MTSATTGRYSNRCLKLIGDFLYKIEGQSAEILTDLAIYRQRVTDAAWRSLPQPLRMLGRARYRWDELFELIRTEVFSAQNNKVAVRENARQLLDTLVARLSVKQSAVPAELAVPALEIKQKEIDRTRPTSSEETASTGKSTDREVAVGIDLGTTYSVVAHLDKHGRPCSIPNASGDVLTPSVVLFDEEGPIVGKEAVLAAAMEPGKVAECVKRDMGARFFRKEIDGEPMPPEVISSLILRSVKADAERKLGPVRKAVITVPAYFDETRRRATMDAGQLAGLEVLDIINEPTAAAIAFGYQLGFLDQHGRTAGDRPLRVLVYDLGGGTFDVTIMEIQGNSFKALATDGDLSLGGKDWDEKLVELAAQEYIRRHAHDPRSNATSLQELWYAVEVAKKTLTERPRAALIINHLGTRLKMEVTRDQFEDATAPLLTRTRTTTEIVVRQAGLSWSAIDKVLLVGGATRMPMVLQMLEELTGKTPERSVSPDEAVAHGAALFADLLLQKEKPATSPPRFSITNVNSHSLGIIGVDPRTHKRRNYILIPKNTPLPHSVTKIFKTHKPNQPNIAIRVVEGESVSPSACTPVGVCTITDLPKDLPHRWPVTINYSYQSNGRLQVTAQLRGYAKGVIATFQRENSLDDENLKLWSEYVEGASRE
jgi:molecular chaperone DnaK